MAESIEPTMGSWGEGSLFLRTKAVCTFRASDPIRKRVLQSKKAEQGQGVMSQLKAEVQSQQSAEEGSESTQWGLQ